ncbi:MAG: peptidoglycan editing factor PgeF [Nocardioidaceae bacterium]|nr:peptidoglycan editing factor PgeF [Nocardioidaceae bacterium]
MFAFQDTAAPVEIAFTDRHGGVSGGPYASLNLAEPGSAAAPAAESDAVRRNVDLVVRAFTGAGDGAPTPSVVRMRQVHGSEVAVADPAAATPTADGLVTRDPGVVLMVRVADCVPVLLADPHAGVVGAAHAGRPGLVAGVVPATVDAMRELGARQVRAWVGPHVCGRCYEVPEQMRADVAAAVPESFAETSWGTPAVDIGAGVRTQLERAGVQLTEVSRCTLEDDDLYSYRRQGTESGRLAGLVWRRP